MTTYVFCWVRLNGETDLAKYGLAPPRPLPLEGRGFQFIVALKFNEAKDLLTKLKSDGHEVHLEDQEATIDMNPEKYQVALRYDDSLARYFLTKIL